MGLRLPPPPTSLDPFAVACDAFTVLGPGVWSSATAVLELRSEGATIDHVVTARPGGPTAAAGDPGHYTSLLADTLATLAPPRRGRGSQRVRVTFTRERDGLTVELEPVTPPLKKTLDVHPGCAVLTAELVTAIDAAMPAIGEREAAWYDATDPDALPSFVPDGTTLALGDAALSAHLLGVYDPRRCHLAWSWEIDGIAPATAQAMARIRDACRGRPGWNVIATPGPRAVHDTTAYVLAWLAGLELGAQGVLPVWGALDGDLVTFVAAMARPS